MTPGSMFPTIARQKPLLALLAYIAAIVGLLLTAGWLSGGLYGEYNANADLRERLAQLDARMQASAPSASDADAGLGSPFIDGATFTQAGATLQQRVERAVEKAGGSLLSSQVDLDNDQAKAGIISLVAEADIAQASLQGFLYDLEAGMPFLFVDTLSVQLPQLSGDGPTPNMHVSIGVSGQWQGHL